MPILKGCLTILLLTISNVFMTLAWYGQVFFKERMSRLGLFAVIVISWLVAFVEYCIMIPANRIGSAEFSGPFSIWELKVIQEALSLVVFTVIVLLVMKNETLRWNHVVGFVCLILAVFFIFKK